MPRHCPSACESHSQLYYLDFPYSPFVGIVLPMDGVYSAGDVVRATGLTPRQIDYLVSQGALTPTVASGKGKGARRYYAPGDVVALRVAAYLRKVGARTQTVEMVISFILKHPRLQSGQDLGHCCLVIDNNSVSFVTESSLATSLTRRRGPMLQVVRLANFAAGTLDRGTGAVAS